MSFQYNVVRRDDTTNVVAFVDGRMLVADENHPNIDAILAKVTANDTDGLTELFDATTEVALRFENLSEMVSVANGRVYVDGDPVDDVYADLIIRFMRDDLDFMPLVKFLEKVYTNTDEHTRENLSRWLRATHGFTIDSDGDIRGYKGLRNDFTSVTAGPATVDGVAVNGHVPNNVGSVVEIARSKVEHNPAVGCASGLHVGTWSYASSFSRGQIVEVKVNPRDVVSVPTDCQDQKMRVTRYRVMHSVDEEYESPYVDA